VEPLLVIVNADAGHADDLAPALELLGEHTSVEVAETHNPGELDGVLHRAGSRPIVVAGGDAALHAVIATLHRRNDLAGKVLGFLRLGPNADPEAAAAALLTATPRPQDLIVDELGEVAVDNVFVSSAYDDQETLLRRVRSFVRPPSLRLRVEVDGEVIADVDRQVRGLSVASPADGTADVILSFAGSLRRLGRPGETHRRGSRVSVTGEDFWIGADGEISGRERRRTWHIEPAAYSLLVS
jgi:diacylglycerol kinase (ATP)